MTTETPPRTFGPLWRIGLAVALLTTAALLWALWPALSAVGSVLASWRIVLAAMLLLFVGGALIAGVWALAALALRLTGHARQAHIVALPNGMPAHVRDVSAARRTRGQNGLLATLLEQSMIDHSAQLLAEKARPTPLLTSQNLHIHNVNPPPQIEAGGTAHALSTESEWLGWTDLAPHLMVAGRTDSGKTTTVEAVLARRIIAGDLVLVIDPHYQPGKWLGAAAIGGGRDYAACYDAFDAIRAMLDKRYQAFHAGTRTEDFRRATIVVDEVPAIIAHAQSQGKAMYERWLLFATSLGSEARKVRISIILSTQSPLVRDIGISSAMRENFIRIALGDTAADLLREEPNADHKQALLDLLRGRRYPAAMEYRNTWYALRNDDVPQLARTNGVTPRVPTLLIAPPTPAHAMPPPPPTVRVSVRAAPPTVPMGITVQEQIEDLLSAQSGWMTASEIAAALRIDLGVIRTEIDTLYNKEKRLTRRNARGKTTKEKYEYQVVQSVQSIITASA